MHILEEKGQKEPKKGWMTLKEASFYIGKPESWMYENVTRFAVPHTRLGIQYRFQPAQLDAWMLALQPTKLDGQLR
jgi:excisionase family DNA binding protein